MGTPKVHMGTQTHKYTHKHFELCIQRW